MGSRGCVGERLRTARRKGNQLPSARLFLGLQVAMDRIKVIAELPGIGFSNFTHFWTTLSIFTVLIL